MIEACTADGVRAAEQPHLAAERSFTGGLMDRAATALALRVRQELRRRRGRVAGARVVALVGPGNNGGDALHALARLARHGVRTTAVLTTDAVHAGGLEALRRAGGRVVTVHRGPVAPRAAGGPGASGGSGAHGEAGAPDDGTAQLAGDDDVVGLVLEHDVVLDGLLGIGARGALREPAAGLVTQLAARCAEADEDGSARPLVLAVDVPSGVGVDDGTRPGAVLPADVTVTFGSAKPVHLLPPADALVGDLQVVDLGLDLPEPAVVRVTPPDVRRSWPVPGRGDHKYSRGVVGVVAGSTAYPGAAVLTTGAAVAAGCGMVRYVGPTAVAGAVVAAHPEVVTGQDPDVHVQAWVLGPGTAPGDEQGERVRAALAAALDQHLPVVVDAGALDLLPLEGLAPQVVLTPHAGELARLLGRLGTDVQRAEVEAEPLRRALEVHRRTGATVLLKGATTLVVGPEVASQSDAPAWLATAGAGDVLAGVVGAALAGTRPGPADVVRVVAAAVLVHGRAAHRACPGGPVSAGDVSRALPAAIAELLAR